MSFNIVQVVKNLHPRKGKHSLEESGNWLMSPRRLTFPGSFVYLVLHLIANHH